MNTKGTAAQLKFMAALRATRYRASYLSLCFLILWLVGPEYTGAQSTANAGTVEGAVFVVDSGGASYVPGAKVVLQSSETLEAETDANGRYVFRDVAPGSHILTASFPG
ncbi:MAG TPA: carboxypeptidase-like regulatory domain-containing protein, partial [Dongiaceae bacterium]|nr:carboxypeptidase-like regulatory domain-containing protein [Dongiaceae bacterium]